MRRGQEVNFDPSKMTPGEWAVSLDSKYVRMCFQPGVCVRMATYDAFEADMVQIRRILAECQTVEEAVQRIYEEIKDVAVDVERIETAAANALKSEQNALNSANSASQSANTAVNKANEASESENTASVKAEQATDGARIATEKASEAANSAENVRNMSDLSQSYAVGGTGTREGEDTDNSKYYNQQASDNADRAEAAAERASSVADVGVATPEKAGLVKPDGETIRVDSDGTIHADRGTTSYADLENKPTINNVELDGNKTIDDLGGLTAESTVSFSQAAERTNIEETDNVKGIFGKVKKWFADLKPHAFSNPTNNLLATVAGTALDAVQGKVLDEKITSVNVSRKTSAQYNTLEEFVEATASNINVSHMGRFKDIGDFTYPLTQKEGTWRRYLISYQNPYASGIASSVGGNGLFFVDSGDVYSVKISGNKDSGLTATYEKLITETELNRVVENIDVSNAVIEINSVGTNAGIAVSDFTISNNNLSVTHLESGWVHVISIGVTCKKTIPANTILTISLNNVNFQKSLSSWGSNPYYDVHADLLNNSYQIKCYYNKETGAGFGFWPTIFYSSSVATKKITK